jgi:peptidoglycan/xylan/chitin deacetylase (PgdA/CDA1 family)
MDFYSIHKSFIRRLHNSYRKNKDDIWALISGIYPSYVYRRKEELPESDIPIFAFHSVENTYFEQQIKYLSENGYRTLRADELYEVIIGNKRPSGKTVVLTFDDGRGSLWSTAYPLLKKYGLCAIGFIVTNNISNRKDHYPNLEDVWNGECSLQEIQLRDSIEPYCSWQEIATMHKSGVIDFQSHTTYHHTIFVSDKIIDFINPSFSPSIMHDDLNPIVRIEGKDIIPRHLEWGRPIYQSAPAMSGKRRYVEDQDFAQACINFVKNGGGIDFFRRPGWRKKLNSLMRDSKKQYGQLGYLQRIEETYKEIRQDLQQSKITIEQRLDKQVKHLCFPWYVGSKLAVKASAEVGYCCNYWGIMGRRAINSPDTNPFYLARMSDDYILTLPGSQRIALYKMFKEKFIRIYNKKSRNKILS